MRRISIAVSALALFLVSASANAQATGHAGHAAPTVSAGDTAGVLAALNQLITALKAKDSLGMRTVLHEQARFTLLRPAPEGGVRVAIFDAQTFPRLVSGPNSPSLDEPIRNLRVTIDADLATVWAEYQVRIDGRVSHCGYDAFDLVRQGGVWKILNVADTFRREGCGPLWP
jgi:hypothetical protein